MQADLTISQQMWVKLCLTKHIKPLAYSSALDSVSNYVYAGSVTQFSTDTVRLLHTYVPERSLNTKTVRMTAVMTWDECRLFEILDLSVKKFRLPKE